MSIWGGGEGFSLSGEKGAILFLGSERGFYHSTELVSSEYCEWKVLPFSVMMSVAGFR